MLRDLVLNKIEELNTELSERKDVPENIKVARAETDFCEKYGSVSLYLLKLFTLNTYKDEDGIANFMLRAIITVFFVFTFAGTINPHIRVETILILSLLFSGIQGVLYEFFAIEMENNETEFYDNLITADEIKFLIEVIGAEEFNKVTEKYGNEIYKSDLLVILENYLTQQNK